MKIFLALVLFACTARAEILVGHYSGAIYSTACPVKVGGNIIMDVSPSGYLRITILDDGATNAVLIGGINERGRFFADGSGTHLAGTARFYNRNRYIIFTGTGRDESCRYKFQGRWRRF